MHERILRKILDGVRVEVPKDGFDTVPLSAVVADAEKFGYQSGSAAFDAVIDAVDNLLEEARALDRLAPDLESTSLLAHGERPNPAT